MNLLKSLGQSLIKFSDLEAITSQLTAVIKR